MENTRQVYKVYLPKIAWTNTGQVNKVYLPKRLHGQILGKRIRSQEFLIRIVFSVNKH